MSAISAEHVAESQRYRLYRKRGITSAREIARIKLEGLGWVGGNAYFRSGTPHASNDARAERRRRANDPSNGPTSEAATTASAAKTAPEQLERGPGKGEHPAYALALRFSVS